MTRIINLNKIICTLKKFGNNNKITKDGLFAEIIKNPQIGEGRCQIIAYQKHVRIGQDLDLLREENKNYILTEFGQNFYDTIPTKNNNQKFIDAINNELKQKLSEKISETPEFIKTKLGETVIDIQIKNGESKIFINKMHAKNISKNILELMKEVDLISYKCGEYKISSKIGHSIPNKRRRPISENELYKILEIQRKNGEKSEEATIEKERTRLRNLGVKESVLDRINRKSKEDSSAGYDIDSFNNAEIGMDFDRFIEVKSTTGDYPIFYWSENEREKARELGDKYFIYIWINFGKSEQRLIEPIQNPYQQIVEKKHGKVKEIVTWEVAWDEREK